MNNNKELLVQFLSSLSILSLFTYIPLWGYYNGLTNSEIALSAVFFGIAILITNLIIGRLSDKIGKRKPFILLGTLITSISVLSFILPSNFIQFSISRALVGIGFGLYIPTLTALIHEKGMKLGKFSSIGTIGWAVGIVISGILGIFFIEFIFIFNAIGLLGAGIVAFYVNEEKTETKKYKDSILKIYWERKRILTSFLIRHSLAVSIWVLWPIYLLSLGADTFMISVIQVLNPITASILMSKYTDKLSSILMVNLGLLLSGITFLSYLLATNPYSLLPSQIILGSSWAFIYVGTLRYAIEFSDFDKSTVSGWINSIQSIAVIIGSIVAFMIIQLGGTIIDIIFIAGTGTLLVFTFNFIYELKINSIKQQIPIN